MLLVGDSTLAPRTGFGDALCALLDPRMPCVNLARGGRSTRSYRADGSWDRVTALLADRSRETFVLIQFGHNDQPGKAERTTNLATEFPANLARYVEEVRAAGATPLLATPLTRRTFRGGALDNDLAPWAAATRTVATELGVPLMDMNARSAAAVASLGAARADLLARDGPDFDHTHLGARGAAYFSRLAARVWAEASPAFDAHFAALGQRPEMTPSQAAASTYREVLGDWDPIAAAAPVQRDLVVDAGSPADGVGRFPTVQSAVNAAVALAAATGRTKRIVIGIQPGTYRELVYVPVSSAPITLAGEGGDPTAVRIAATLEARTSGEAYGAAFGPGFAGAPAAVTAMFDSVRARPAVGTSGSAITWIRNAGFEARNLTFENGFHKDRGNELDRSQAVALMVEDADRASFTQVRFIGYQDTLYLRASVPRLPPRVFVRDSYVEGDVDFIFGEATAYFLRTEVRSLGDHGESYALAPSTDRASRHGFVFMDCRFTHDGSPNALRGTFKLGRQWFRGGDPDAVGKVAILDSRIGAHIDKARPWADWGQPGSPRYRAVQYDYLGEFRSLDE